MTLKIRRFLYLSFILLFLIISPLVALYAAGFNLNFKNIVLQKTGTLILDSAPENALITLKSGINNFDLTTIFSKIFNRPNEIYTPAKIKKLTPGEYTVTVLLPGYWPWEKKLLVFPGKSTFAENIKLFIKDEPILASKGKVFQEYISNNKNYMLLDHGNEEILLSLNDANELWPTIKNNLKTAPAWSPNDQKILVGSNIFNVSDLLSDYNAEPTQNLASFFATSSTAIKWGDDNSIYYILNKKEKDGKNFSGLFKINLSEQTSTAVLDNKSITDYLPLGNRLLTIEKFNHSSLNIYDSGNFNLTRTINLPAGDYSFKGSYLNYLILSDSNKNIYIIDPGADDQSVLKKKLENANNLIWVNSEKIFYHNDYEIWELNLSNDEKNIITRISTKISSVHELPSLDYIIYATEKNIYALELDERGHRNLTNLVEMDGINFPELNILGDTLYFYSSSSQNEGYYKLKIR